MGNDIGMIDPRTKDLGKPPKKATSALNGLLCPFCGQPRGHHAYNCYIEMIKSNVEVMLSCGGDTANDDLYSMDELEKAWRVRA